MTTVHVVDNNAALIRRHRRRRRLHAEQLLSRESGKNFPLN